MENTLTHLVKYEMIIFNKKKQPETLNSPLST